MNPYNLKVGDKIYYKTIENNPQIGYTEVTFIGRKYFQVKGSYEKFNLDSPFGRDRRVRFYPDEQCYLDELKRIELTRIIREYIAVYSQKLTLNQLEQIIKIIQGNNDEIR